MEKYSVDIKKILITGSTGFIGSNLVKSLFKHYHLYCLYKTHKGNLDHNISYIQHDLSKPIDTNALPSDVDCIIHLAASMDKTKRNSELFQINTVSTLNLLEYGKSIGIKKFIFVSSGGVYGYSTKPHTEGALINPIDFYGLSKYQSELLINHYSQNFSTVILRPFFHYGNGQMKGLLPLLADKIKNNVQIIIYNDGNPKINPIYITDVINVIKKSMLLDGQHILNVAGNEITSVKELANAIGRCIKSKPIFKYVDDRTIIDLIGDNTNTRRVLGIAPEVALEQGIQNFLE